MSKEKISETSLRIELCEPPTTPFKEIQNKNLPYFREWLGFVVVVV